MNDTQIERLALMAHSLRPDWPTSSLTTWLRADHADKPYRDVATALAWVACDENTRTPKRMNESGPWWPADAGSPMHERPSDPSWPYCEIPGHPRIKPGTKCTRCEHEAMTDEKALPESELTRRAEHRPEPVEPSDGYQRTKQALEDAGRAERIGGME